MPWGLDILDSGLDTYAPTPTASNGAETEAVSDGAYSPAYSGQGVDVYVPPPSLSLCVCVCVCVFIANLCLFLPRTLTHRPSHYSRYSLYSRY